MVTGGLPGWVQMGRRLALSTTWSRARTVTTSHLAHDDLIAAGGNSTLAGLRGAVDTHHDGATCEIIRTLRLDHTPLGRQQ